MLLSNPYVALAGGAAVVAAVVGSFFFGIDVGSDRILADQKRTEQIVAEVSAAAQTAAANEISKIKVVNRNTQQVLERETRIVPDYSRCQHSSNGLQAVNAALENRAVPAGASGVPNADAPR